MSIQKMYGIILIISILLRNELTSFNIKNNKQKLLHKCTKQINGASLLQTDHQPNLQDLVCTQMHGIVFK